MEQQVQIFTADDPYAIHGTLNYLKEGNPTLLIFVHGLSGNQYEHHYFNAAKFFTKKGFDTFRFDFYGRKENARPLVESSITTHTKDLTSVIDFFRDKYQNIMLIGHSLGCGVILNTSLKYIERIVLWDPTAGMKTLEEKKCEFVPQLNRYVLHWGMDIIIGEDMVQEWKQLTDIRSQVAKITVPCKFIFAGRHNKYIAWGPFLSEIQVEHENVTIADAEHCFYEEGTEEQLFEETLKWIQ